LRPWRGANQVHARTGGTAIKTVPVDAVVNGEERFEELPERVRDALGELAGAAKEGCSRSASASGSACSTS
jgi:hypothetical protein